MRHGYYGRLDGKAPTLGVHYFMLDIYMKKVIAAEARAFKKELGRMFVQFRQEAFAGVDIMKKKISAIEDKVKQLNDNKRFGHMPRVEAVVVEQIKSKQTPKHSKPKKKTKEKE